MKKQMIGTVLVTLALGAFAAGPQQGPVAVKTAKPETIEESEPYVAVARTEGSQKVTLGEQIGDKVIVEEGLKADEAFVVTGTHKLRDGAAVKEM